jgi:enoyl-CoA hydratase
MSQSSSENQLVIATKPKKSVLLLELNNRPKRNALTKSLLLELSQALKTAAGDPATKAVVVYGGDEFFSAGADIADMAARGVDAYLDPDRLASWRTIEIFEKPLIAAVNGYAFGGGFELALLADIIVAGQTASFGLPEVTIGAIPGDGGTQRLTRLIGKSQAMRMILTGDPINGDEAKACGIAAEVVEPKQTLARALELAERIAERPAVAVRLAKEAVLRAERTLLEEGLQLEQAAVRKVFATTDRLEGHRAFIEKRKPRFRDH